MKLDLDRPRNAAAILNDALRLFFAHYQLFFTAPLLLVTPVTVLVGGLWGRELQDGPAETFAAPDAVATLLTSLVILPLVTAIHVIAVQRLANGEEPQIGVVLREALTFYAPVLGVTLLYVLAIFCGVILLILPGIWLAIRFYFGAQVAVVEGLRGMDALRRSADLVKGHWWRVFGIQLLLGLLGGVVASLIAGIAGETGSGLVYVVVFTLCQAFALSITALGGTLLFFDLRRPVVPVRGFDPPVAA